MIKKHNRPPATQEPAKKMDVRLTRAPSECSLPHCRSSPAPALPVPAADAVVVQDSNVPSTTPPDSPHSHSRHHAHSALALPATVIGVAAASAQSAVAHAAPLLQRTAPKTHRGRHSVSSQAHSYDAAVAPRRLRPVDVACVSAPGIEAVGAVVGVGGAAVVMAVSDKAWPLPPRPLLLPLRRNYSTGRRDDARVTTAVEDARADPGDAPHRPPHRYCPVGRVWGVMAV